MSTFPNQNIPPQITTTVPALRPLLSGLFFLNFRISRQIYLKQLRSSVAEEMLNPIEELQIGKEEFSFPGGNADIITEVQNTLNPPKAIEVDDSDDNEMEDDKISVSAAINRVVQSWRSAAARSLQLRLLSRSEGRLSH
ncbi:hypothetical protein BC835DRAFT_1309932 [Cytidiella melzeri]|nr:hypothetical protein BC835DRAFT_1309932 [Cytidiella melzeri]